MAPGRGARTCAVKIDADFDGGNIVVMDGDDDGATALELRPDNASPLTQWFCFRSWGEPGERRAFRIENAGGAEYPDGWDGYEACASYDGEVWFRVPTWYEDGVLGFEIAPARRGVTLACFAPYPHARLRRLVARAARSGRADVVTLGETVQGRPIQAISFGDAGPAAARVWIIARQHPGETMAAWCAEGIVERLLDPSDPVAAALREDAIVTVVPCVNIDGGVLGNHRTNAAGRDLNRAWDAPDLVETPEVFAVRRAIVETGVDLFLDVHGDEALPFVFAAGNEGNPGYSPRIAALETTFKERLHVADPSFSPDQGYPADAPGEADLSCAANWIGERFDCLALTMEMPFKDDARHPRPARGWTPARSRATGRAMLEAALLSLPDLR
jgi:murein tripeptide amidase MpaA